MLSTKNTIVVPSGNECTSDEGITITLPPEQTEAIFECGSGFATLQPGQTEKKQVFATPACDVPTDLDIAVPGATWDDSGAQQNIYKLTFPANRLKEYTVYYQCKNPGGMGALKSLPDVHGISEQRGRMGINQIPELEQTCKVTIVAQPEPMATDPGPVKTCSKFNNAVYIKLGPTDTQAVFRCSDKRSTVVPAQTPQAQFCESADCTNPQQLNTAIPGAYWDGRNNAAHIYRVVIPAEGRKETQLWYKCTNTAKSVLLRSGNPKQSQGGIQEEEPTDPCPVLIRVKTTESNDDEDGDKDVEECTVGTEKKVTLFPSSPVRFRCKFGTNLQPTFSAENPQVYDDSNGACNAPVALTSLVDATLTEDRTHDTYSKYDIELKTSPTEVRKLCLQCSYGMQNCKMRIQVPGTDSTTSGSGGLFGFESSVVGLVLCIGFLFAP
ncbi:UNVERIFIED_CONTAM: SAG-related sequence SRS59J [Hammondia hammondi]|eukprot:XP_008888922.1 SAG-related sequence SRS59J [Hammondia hammondi]